MDAQREDMSRISIDSLQDWQRIKTNYTNAALAALDEELPSSGSSAERDVLVRHLNQFIDRTFDMTRPNIRINGRNFEEIDIAEEGKLQEESFDEGFDRHIWSLAEQSLKWDREIASRRRKHPKEVEKLMEELLERQRDLDEELARKDVDDHEHLNNLHRDLPAATYDNIEQVALKVNAITEELKQSIPLQSERSDRVQILAAELKALKL